MERDMNIQAKEVRVTLLCVGLHGRSLLETFLMDPNGLKGILDLA